MPPTTLIHTVGLPTVDEFGGNVCSSSQPPPNTQARGSRVLTQGGCPLATAAP